MLLTFSSNLPHYIRYRAERPKIQDQFADLKRELASVPESAWDAIPDVGDHTLKLKQKRKAEQYTPMTDALLQVHIETHALSTSKGVLNIEMKH